MNILFRCSDEQNCTVPVTNEIFGNPCPGTPKYIEAQYVCTLPGNLCVLFLIFASFLSIHITYNIVRNWNHFVLVKRC